MSSLISIGTSVVAKWPSTSNYYKARIVDYTEDRNYVCEFLDGSIIALPTKYVDLPEKFQRTTKKLSLMHSEQMFFDRSLTFNSLMISLAWIAVFLYVQYWFHFNSNVDGYTSFEQYPSIAIRYLVIWFSLQLIFARILPHIGEEQLIYIKESFPSISYKHQSNSLLAFILTCSMMIICRDKLPLRELTKSFYLLAVFSLGIVLTMSLIILTSKLSSRYSITSNIHRNDHRFDIHLFLSIRPGILLWPALNLLLLLTILKYNRQISVRLALSIVLQTIYILNVFLNETTMIRQSLDISPPLSFDALFTNLCWVPFMATLTSFYIGKSHHPISNYFLLLAICLFTFGFFLQRLAMRQRATFQNAVTVNDNQRILTSGCWRWCRNPHLLAEIGMALGWSLPGGITHFIPWIYAFYIIGMSIYKAQYFDRLLRQSCSDTAYNDYVTQVKYTLVPYVY